MAVEYDLVQSGTSSLGGWVEGIAVIGASSVPTAGLMFQIPTAPTLHTMVLRLVIDSPPSVLPLDMQLRTELDPGVFSGSNFPESGDRLALTYIEASDTTIDLGFGGVDTPFSNSNFRTVAYYLSREGHSGKVAFSIASSVATGHIIDINNTKLLVETVGELSGLEGSIEAGKLSRPEFCSRCGHPVFRQDLVKDGYTRTLVCQDCYDPTERRPVRLRRVREINP